MRTIELDSQVLTGMQKCWQYFDLRFLQNWHRDANKVANVEEVEVDDEGSPLEKGDIAHIALKHYYSTQALYQDMPPEVPRPNKLDTINEAIEIARLEGTKQDLPMSELTRILEIMQEYFHYYVDKDNFNIILVEKPFSKVLYESEEDDLRIVYTGIIDLGIDSPMTKNTPMDHKTKGKWYPTYELNNQFIGYAWALESNWVIENKIGFQKKEPKGGRFQRKIHSVPPYLIEKWKQQAIDTVKEGIYNFERGRYPHRFGSCNMFGGCEYMMACNTPDKEIQREKLMQFFYKGIPWSPYSRDGHIETKK